MAVATLAVRVSAQIAEFQKSFADATRTAEKFAGEFEGIATRASAVGTFFGTIAADIARSIASGLGSAIRDAVKFSSEFNNAFIGLSSVSRAFGTDADLASAAARRLSSDGLLPLKDSATGLKNLLATGFSLDEATRLMGAFKDSAAFGRQGALSFGDAIRSATEGVKNGNSILVDNAGITKNLSQILKEAGLSATDLSKASSDATVRQALFNGILKEASAFTGDAAKLTETYSGQVSKLTTQYQNALATIGDAITQNATVAKAIGAVSEAFGGLTAKLTDNKRGFLLVSDAVVLFVRGLAEAINIIDLLQTAFAGLQQFSNRLFMTFADLAIAVLKVAERTNEVLKYLDPQNYRQHADAVTHAKEAYTFLEGAVKGFKDASADAQTRSNQWGNALQGVRATLKTLERDLVSTRGKTVALGAAGDRVLRTNLSSAAKGSAAAMEGLEKSTTRTIGAFKQSDSALQQYFRSLGFTAIRLKENIDAQGRLTDAVRRFVPQIDSTSASYERIGKAIRQTASDGDLFAASQEQTARVIDFATRKLLEQARAWFDLGQGMASFGGALGGTAGQIIGDIGGMISQFEDLKKATEEMQKSGTASWGQQAQSMLNWASLVVGTVTTVVAFLERNDAKFRQRLQFVEQMGGLFALQNAALTAGMPGAVANLQGASGQIPQIIDRINRGLSEAQARMDRYGLSWRDLGDNIRQSNIDTMTRALLDDWRILSTLGIDATDAMAGGLSQLVVEAVNTGSKIPIALQPILEKLIRMGGLTEEAARAMLGLQEDSMPALADIKDAAERYGLTLDQLGPKVAQLQISETASQIVKDFELLMLAGADVGVVMGAMQDKVQGLVNNALTLGLKIPESMRPLLEQMIQAGLLTDNTGKKLTDVGDIPFAKDLTKSVEDLIKKLDELIDRFSDVESAAEAAARKRRELIGQLPATGPGVDTELPSERRRATVFGGEEIVTARVSGGGAELEDRSITVNTHLDGQRIASSTVRHLPRILDLHGV